MCATTVIPDVERAHGFCGALSDDLSQTSNVDGSVVATWPAAVGLCCAVMRCGPEGLHERAVAMHLRASFAVDWGHR